MRWMFWSLIRWWLGAPIMWLGDRLYWAGKHGQRRATARQKQGLTSPKYPPQFVAYKPNTPPPPKPKR